MKFTMNSLSTLLVNWSNAKSYPWKLSINEIALFKSCWVDGFKELKIDENCAISAFVSTDLGNRELILREMASTLASSDCSESYCNSFT